MFLGELGGKPRRRERWDVRSSWIAYRPSRRHVRPPYQYLYRRVLVRLGSSSQSGQVFGGKKRSGVAKLYSHRFSNLPPGASEYSVCRLSRRCLPFGRPWRYNDKVALWRSSGTAGARQFQFQGRSRRRAGRVADLQRIVFAKTRPRRMRSGAIVRRCFQYRRCSYSR